MLITTCTDHNHSRNYCIYATVCATVRCRMVCGNTSGSALCQTQLHHWIPAWSFSWFPQYCQTNIVHNHFLAHTFQVGIMESTLTTLRREENKPVLTTPPLLPNIPTTEYHPMFIFCPNSKFQDQPGWFFQCSMLHSG
jgi:hypothetical protein